MLSKAQRPVEQRTFLVAAQARLTFVKESLARFLAIAELEQQGRLLHPVLAVMAEREGSSGHSPQVDNSDARQALPFTPYYPLNMVHAAEPRISATARCLSALLSTVSLFDDKHRVLKPDGFRLRSLRTWTARCRPGDTEPIEHYLATGVCNVNCDFCYEHGTPTEMRTPRFRVSRAEIETRLKYYDPKKGVALFDIFHQYYDAFAHPDWHRVLRSVRAKTNGMLDLITNGRTLTPGVISQLDELRPLRLIVSLNSQDPALRARVMKDRTPEVAAAALPLLAQARLPFGIVVVPWPPELNADELDKTVRFVDAFEPMFVSISLPGYTRYFPLPPVQLDESYQKEIVARVRTLRLQVRTPLLVQPRMMEACWHQENHVQPFVLGAIPSTSAERAGLRYGDVLTQINGFEVSFSFHAQRFLSLLDRNGQERLELVVKRQTVRLEMSLERLPKDGDLGFGLILANGLDPALFIDIVNELLRNPDGAVWILSSTWMLDSVHRHLKLADPNGDAVHRITCIGVPNAYFGGNIGLGDLLTVQDFVACIRAELRRRRKPSRIYIPQSPFTGWRRDLRGESVQRLKRLVDIPISIVANDRIMV